MTKEKTDVYMQHNMTKPKNNKKLETPKIMGISPITAP